MSELTDDQARKALEIALDGATKEEVEVIKETQEAKGRGDLFKEMVEDQAEVIEFEPIGLSPLQSMVQKEIHDDILEAQEKIFKAMEVPGNLIHPEEGSEDFKKLVSGIQTRKTDTTRKLVNMESTETEVERAKRLMLDAAENLPGAGLADSLRDCASKLLEKDQYEAVVIVLSRMSGKPARVVRRVLASKLNVKRRK